jgi:hypothetical protein
MEAPPSASVCLLYWGFTGTKVQILTQARGSRVVEMKEETGMLTYADVC